MSRDWLPFAILPGADQSRFLNLNAFEQLARRVVRRILFDELAADGEIEDEPPQPRQSVRGIADAVELGKKLYRRHARASTSAVHCRRRCRRSSLVGR